MILEPFWGRFGGLRDNFGGFGGSFFEVVFLMIVGQPRRASDGRRGGGPERDYRERIIYRGY